MDLKDELQKQLHEQYAINNNDRMASMITLFVSLIVVLGAYGYMYIHTQLNFAENLGKLSIGTGYGWDMYTIDVLLLVAIVCQFVLWMLQHLCIYQGSYQRYEQFIVGRIRYKAGLKDIFYDGYSFKNKNYWNFIQGIYGELLPALQIVFWGIVIATIIKLYDDGLNWTRYGICLYLFFLIESFLVCLNLEFYKIKRFKKYKKIEKSCAGIV